MTYPWPTLMPMGIVVISCVRPSVHGLGFVYCIQSAWKKWPTIWHADVSRWLTLSIHGCLWILLLVHLSVCSFTAFFLRLGLGQRRAVVIIGRWLLPSLVDTRDICCHYWQHILVFNGAPGDIQGNLTALLSFWLYPTHGHYIQSDVIMMLLNITQYWIQQCFDQSRSCTWLWIHKKLSCPHGWDMGYLLWVFCRTLPMLLKHHTVSPHSIFVCTVPSVYMYVCQMEASWEGWVITSCNIVWRWLLILVKMCLFGTQCPI